MIEEPLRILHVIPAVAKRYGGPSQAIFEMCRALSDKGYDVVIATTDADGAQRLPVEIGSEVTHQDVRVIFFRRLWNEPFGYSRQLARWLGDNVARFSVVHAHAVFSHASFAAASACRGSEVPY